MRFMKSNINILSYNSDETIEYYKRLNTRGLFNYEQILISEYFDENTNILDIGCGAGRTTLKLKEQGFKVVGIDFSEEMIKVSKKINNTIDYQVQNIIKTNFCDNQFDGALFSFNGLMLLCSLEDRMKAMQEINRIIRKEGIFIFTTPYLDNKINKGYWKEKINSYGKELNKFTEVEKIELGDEILEDNGSKFYIHVPFLREIRKLIIDCGFSIVFEVRRLDYFNEENNEQELDDNYIWVIKNEKNRIQRN